MNKSVSKPFVSFMSNASHDVTGSAHVLKFKQYTMLLDCGWIQQSDILSDYKANREQVANLKPRTIQYVCVSHLNLDHHGAIPAMIAKGMNAHIFVPTGSIPFLRLMWEDSLRIMQGDCEKIHRHHGIKAPPLYDERDIENAINRCIEVDIHTPYHINQDMTLTYFNAGHIYNSCQMLIELHDGPIVKRVMYSGDIGSPTHRPFVAPRENPGFADLAICEATYSAKGRVNSIKDRDKDIAKIKSIVSESNKILMATFSLDRCQSLLSILYNNGIMDEIPVVLDSPLASKFCALWPDVDGWPKPMEKVKVITDPIESKELQMSNRHMLILASSGTLSGGRAVSHLKTLLPDPRNHLIFTGYTQENSIASLIKSNQKQININGELVDNNANFTALMSMSSHANYNELLDYYADELRYNKIAIVHSDWRHKTEFCHTLQDRLVEQGKSARVICCQQDSRVYI